MGNVAFVVSQKINHLTPTLLYCIRSCGPDLVSVSVATAELVVGDIR